MVHDPMATYQQDGMDDLAPGLGDPPWIYLDTCLVFGDTIVLYNPPGDRFTISDPGIQEIVDRSTR